MFGIFWLKGECQMDSLPSRTKLLDEHPLTCAGAHQLNCPGRTASPFSAARVTSA